MAEVRCPMCGKPNPADLEICQFCKARLKPLLAGSPDSTEKPRKVLSPKKTKGLEPELPDWLRALKSDADASPPQKPSQDETADWMQPEEKAPAESEAGGQPDWLAGLRQGGEGDIKEEPEEYEPPLPLGGEGPGRPEDEVPDWLASLRKASGPLKPYAPDENEVSRSGPKMEEDEPDWLRRIRSLKESEEQAGPGEGELEAQDWQSMLQELGDQGEARADSEAKMPAEEEEPQEEASPAKSITDWLAGLDQPGAQTSPTELPDWMQAVSPKQTASLPESGDELPDWLAAGAQEPAVEKEEPAAAPEPAPEPVEPPESAAEPTPAEELPGWLKPEPKETARLEDYAKEVQSSTTPDWLESLMGAPSEAEAAPRQEQPSWLSRAIEPPQPSQEPAESAAWTESEEGAAETGEKPEEQIPDWLSGIVAGEPAEPVLPEAEPGELPEWLVPLEASASSFEETLPPKEEAAPQVNWPEQEVKPVEPGTPPAVTPPPAHKLPTVAPFTMAGEEIGPMPEGEVPEWLSGVVPSEIIPEAEQPPAEPGLAPAELPTWLEAMRPVETSAEAAPILDEKDKHYETAGPLSGLRGVLQSESGVVQRKKPAAYAIKLQASDIQQTHAALWEELVKGEAEPRPLPRRLVVSSQHLLRIAIFLLLALAILWRVYTGSQTVPLPDYMPENYDFDQTIVQVGEGVPVLVAVDYDPGFSGEMEAAAGPVIDQLMVKGNYLTLVSTVPTGPAQAERLIKLVNDRNNHHYQGIGQYANLGYIPGGATGLSAFVQTPRQVLPYTLDGGLVWQQGLLQDVHGVGNFGLVLVITENPDTARYWIEQVHPFLVSTPMLMVLSAQAEPLVRPYYEAIPRQIQGMVTGLAGGAAYEQFMPRNGPARRYWDAYSTGIVVAGLLILAGGIFNAIFRYSRRNQEGEL
jgi:hypothetical protein